MGTLKTIVSKKVPKGYTCGKCLGPRTATLATRGSLSTHTFIYTRWMDGDLMQGLIIVIIINF